MTQSTLFGDGKPKPSNLEERKVTFENKVVAVAHQMGLPDSMIEEFLNHWMEHNDNGYVMRFEQQKTWNTGGRLRTWKLRDKKFNPKKKKDEPTGSGQAEIISRRYNLG